MNGRPLSNKKKVQLLVLMTLLAWATQTLVHQWGFGAEIPPGPVASIEKFVPAPPQYAPATLELRAEAVIVGADIKVKQIFRWSDADAAVFVPIADLVVARVDPNAPFKGVALDQVQTTLRDAGVNLGAIHFAGAMHCTVTRRDAQTGEKATLEQWIAARREPAAGEPAQPEMGANSALEITPAVPASSVIPPLVRPTSRPLAAAADPAPTRSLRDILLADLAIRLSLPPESLQVSFNPKDDNVLNLAEPQFRFNLEPQNVRNLGQVAWDVLVVAGNGTRKTPIVASARAWQTQTVANKPVAYHQIIRGEDVIERRALVDRLGDEPLATISQVVGQQASRELKPGTVLVGRSVEAVPLVNTGQFVTVTCTHGRVTIVATARAMEGGSFGQSIRLKNEATGETIRGTLTGPQQATVNDVTPPSVTAQPLASIHP